MYFIGNISAMTTEGQKNEIVPQGNETEVETYPAHKKLVRKSLEECLLDSSLDVHELFELYDRAEESFTAFQDLVERYEKKLKNIKEKRFQVHKPINTYMLDEKIEFLEMGIKFYRDSFQKINKDIKRKLKSIYGKKLPEEEIKKSENRQKGFSKLHKDAIKNLKEWRDFYQKVLETKK